LKPIIDRGWTSGITGQAVETPWDPDGIWGLDGPPPKPLGYHGNSHDGDCHDEEPSERREVSCDDDDEDDDDDQEFIYIFDPVHEVVAKVSRVACIEENTIYTLDANGKEVAEGSIEEWDSHKSQDGKTIAMGKTELIWQLKELLRGKAKSKAEGLASPPGSPKKSVSTSIK
jgi:hypothetical protein